MKKLLFVAGCLLMLAACSTPGPITARPDPNASTSGTVGSVKATDGSVNRELPDTSAVRK